MSTRGKRSQIVLRGLDPRIHVLFRATQGVDGRDEPGQDEIQEAIFLALSLQEFPRTALRFRGDDEHREKDRR